MSGIDAVVGVIQKHRMTPYEDGEGGWLFRGSTPEELASHLAPLIAEAQAEALEAAAATIRRDHIVPTKSGAQWSYRDGYYDGAMKAAGVLRNRAAETRRATS